MIDLSRIVKCNSVSEVAGAEQSTAFLVDCSTCVQHRYLKYKIVIIFKSAELDWSIFRYRNKYFADILKCSNRFHNNRIYDIQYVKLIKMHHKTMQKSSLFYHITQQSANPGLQIKFGLGGVHVCP